MQYFLCSTATHEAYINGELVNRTECDSFWNESKYETFAKPLPLLNKDLLMKFNSIKFDKIHK